jgi:hypothetical protein
MFKPGFKFWTRSFVQLQFPKAFRASKQDPSLSRVLCKIKASGLLPRASKEDADVNMNIPCSWEITEPRRFASQIVRTLLHLKVRYLCSQESTACQSLGASELDPNLILVYYVARESPSTTMMRRFTTPLTSCSNPSSQFLKRPTHLLKRPNQPLTTGSPV